MQKSAGILLLGLATLFTYMLLYHTPLTAALIMACISILMLGLDWSRANFIFYLALFCIAIMVETASVQFGAWSYPQPDLWGIPMWIPLMWANGGLAIVHLQRLIKARARRS